MTWRYPLVWLLLVGSYFHRCDGSCFSAAGSASPTLKQIKVNIVNIERCRQDHIVLQFASSDNVICVAYEHHLGSSCNVSMMTSSKGNLFRVTDPLCGEFTGPRWNPRTKAGNFDVFFDLRPNKRLSKQSWGWWFETLSRSLWRHCYGEQRSFY